MRQYILPDDYDGSGFLEISGEDYHYLTRVLRKRAGDRFSGLDPLGNRVSVLLKTSGSGRCILEISVEATQTGAVVSEGRPVEITLFQCIAKGQKMDTIVRQAAEAGVARVVPVQSENSVPRFDEESSEKKLKRWFRIASQAMQQSGRQRALEIVTPISVSELPQIWSSVSAPGDVGLVFHEKQLYGTMIHRLLSPAVRAVGICIGPEGGFSPNEVTGLLNTGFQPVYINTHILRTETAALYAVAAVQTVILEKDSWTIR